MVPLPGPIGKGLTDFVFDRHKYRQRTRKQPLVAERPASEMDRDTTGSPEQAGSPGIVRRLIRRVTHGSSD